MSTRAIETPSLGTELPGGGARPSTIQWSAVAAGALAGFATTLLMATLGAALGVSVGAVLADEPMSRSEAGRAALGFGVGSAAWALLTAAVVGCVGGTVLNRTARRDRPYLPMALATLTWTGGVLLALLVAAPGAAALGGGVGGGAAAAAGGAAVRAMEDPGALRPPADADRAERREASTAREEAELRESAAQASQAAAAAAWLLLGTQLVSLASTMLAARFRRERIAPYAMGAPALR